MKTGTQDSGQPYITNHASACGRSPIPLNQRGKFQARPLATCPDHGEIWVKDIQAHTSRRIIFTQRGTLSHGPSWFHVKRGRNQQGSRWLGERAARSMNHCQARIFGDSLEKINRFSTGSQQKANRFSTALWEAHQPGICAGRSHFFNSNRVQSPTRRGVLPAARWGAALWMATASAR